jgi:hypothetical protein
MLLTLTYALPFTQTPYAEALDYLARMNVENKINDNTTAIFYRLYAKELDILAHQGYFNPSMN